MWPKFNDILTLFIFLSRVGKLVRYDAIIVGKSEKKRKKYINLYGKPPTPSIQRVNQIYILQLVTTTINISITMIIIDDDDNFKLDWGFWDWVFIGKVVSPSPHTQYYYSSQSIELLQFNIQLFNNKTRKRGKPFSFFFTSILLSNTDSLSLMMVMATS